MDFNNFEELLALVRGKTNKVVVPGANNSEVMAALRLGTENGIISGGVLIGPEQQVRKMAAEAGLEPDKFRFIDGSEYQPMCEQAVDLVKSGEGDFLIKGLVDTKYYMKAILRKEAKAVPEGSLLSHFALFQVHNYHKLFALTDVAVVISPTLEQKAKIIDNTVRMMRAIGVECPKVSCICPVEKVNPKIPSSVDADQLVKMNRNGGIRNCHVEGPYDVYIAFSKKLAAEKLITDMQNPGETDIALMPDLDAANASYKYMTLFGGAKNAALLAGANIPVLLPSRADTSETKLNSIALACYLKGKKL